MAKTKTVTAWMALLFLGQAHAGSLDPLSDFIVGGALVSDDDPIYQSVVLIDVGADFCSGTMIGPELVVTAAHCLTYGSSHENPVPKDAVRVSFPGTYDPHGALRFAHILGFEVSPGWPAQSGQQKDQGDIALLRMRGMIPSRYKAADIWPQRVSLAPGTQAVLAGFGVSAYPSSEPTGGKLRKASVPVEDPDFGQTEVVLDQSKGAGACHGDSGGPAFVMSDQKPFFWGVASRGDGDCMHRVYYTRISPYQDWLKQAAARLGVSQ